MNFLYTFFLKSALIVGLAGAVHAGGFEKCSYVFLIA